MSTIEVLSRVRDTHQAHLVRRRKDGRSVAYDCKPHGTGRTSGWTLVDATTANAGMQIYERLTPEQRAKIANVSLSRYVDFVWKCAR